MLVLTQKVGEAVIIGADIEVRVLGVQGDSIKVGYTAPKSVNIVREKLRDRLVEAGVEIHAEKDNVKRPRYRSEK